jgi:hypothetical protein
MIKLIFSLTLVVGLSVSTRVEAQVKTSQISYSIINYHDDEWLFKGAKPISLTYEEIQLALKKLDETVKNYNEALGNKSFAIKNLNNYKAQIVPVMNKNGEKEVWINCFCETSDIQWKEKIIMVKDGGNCYFNLKINLKTLKVYDFGVNGSA